MEILEGLQCLLPALQARQRKFKLILIKQGRSATHVGEIITLAQAQSIPIKFVAAAELDTMTKGRSHGGVAAICSAKPATEVSAIIELVQMQNQPALLLLIEGTEDAQNLGYTLRSAEALGAHAVLLKKHVWNFDDAALSRASSGAFERLPLARVENLEKDLTPFKRMGIRFWGCLGGAKRDIYQADLSQSALLAIGGERRGLSGAMRSQCDGFIRIPMNANASSLSLSHAACIVLAEAMRQRFAGKRQKPNMDSSSEDSKN